MKKLNECNARQSFAQFVLSVLIPLARCLSLSLFSPILMRTGPYFVLKLVIQKASADTLAATALREKLGQPDNTSVPTWIRRWED